MTSTERQYSDKLEVPNGDRSIRLRGPAQVSPGSGV